MAPQRLDRAEVRRRIGERVAPWVLDELLDAYEPAWMASMANRPKPGRDRPTVAPAPRPQPPTDEV